MQPDSALDSMINKEENGYFSQILLSFAFLKKQTVPSMLSIKVKDNESIDKALKRFKKKFDRAGIMREYRGRKYYEKPSVERRDEIIRASYRQQKQSQREQE